jgi:hypothetical protein
MLRLMGGRRPLADVALRTALLAMVLLVMSGSAGASWGASRARPAAVCPPGGKPTLIAKALLPRGVLGSVIVRRHLYTIVKLRCRLRVIGAFTRPESLMGLVVRYDIFPGQQLTRRDFRVAATTP